MFDISFSVIFKSLLLSIYFFILPISPMLILVALSIGFDTIMGLISAYVNKEPIMSRKMARIIIKLFLYTAVTILVYKFDILLLSDIFNWDSSKFIPTKIVVGMLIFIEGYSIDEKIRKINHNKGIKYYWFLILKTIKKVKSDINEINENPNK